MNAKSHTRQSVSCDTRYLEIEKGEKAFIIKLFRYGSVSCDKINNSYKAQDLNLKVSFYPSSSKSDQHEFSRNINTLSKEKVMRINKMITLGKML